MELTKTRMVSMAMLAIIVAGLCIAVAPVAAAQSTANNSPTANANALPLTKNVQLNGHVYIKVDNETIKFYPVNTTLTLTVNDKFGGFAFIGNVYGTVEFNSTTYTIESGTGIVFPCHHTILDCQGIDPNGNYLNFTLRGDLTAAQSG
jgi:hypothetical protein